VKTLYGTQYVTGNIADVICKLLLLVACWSDFRSNSRRFFFLKNKKVLGRITILAWSINIFAGTQQGCNFVMLIFFECEHWGLIVTLINSTYIRRRAFITKKGVFLKVLVSIRPSWIFANPSHKTLRERKTITATSYWLALSA
jgi:hypothetical protein